MLPCLNKPRITYCPDDATPEMIATLEHERDGMTDRINFLTRNRDAMADYLDAVRNSSHSDAPSETSTNVMTRNI